MKPYLECIALFALLVSSASAAVVYSGEQNLTVAGDSLEGVYLNFENGDIATVYPDDFDNKPWINITLGGYGIFNGEVLRPVAASAGEIYNPELTSDHYLNVDAGTIIDASTAFVVDGWASQHHMGSSGESGKFSVGNTGFIAFEFTNTAESTVHYGWLRLVPGNESGTIVDWAYENTPGQAIQVGAVPEPSLAGIAAVAMIGALLKRRRN
jgi:hypothetical protein